MENKLPFYMAYPVPLLYNDDRNARRDYDYMKSIYPDRRREYFLIWKRNVTEWNMTEA